MHTHMPCLNTLLGCSSNWAPVWMKLFRVRRGQTAGQMTPVWSDVRGEGARSEQTLWGISPACSTCGLWRSVWQHSCCDLRRTRHTHRLTIVKLSCFYSVSFFLPDIFYEGFFSCVRSCYIHNITKRQRLQNVAPPVMFLELSEHTLLEGL